MNGDRRDPERPGPGSPRLSATRQSTACVAMEVRDTVGLSTIPVGEVQSGVRDLLPPISSHPLDSGGLNSRQGRSFMCRVGNHLVILINLV